MAIERAIIRPKRSTKTEWEQYNPILLEGELGIENPDTGTGTGLVKIKIGDGITPWNSLPYALDNTISGIYGGNVTNYEDIWLRSGTLIEWTTSDPILGVGEIVYDSTTNSIKIGDGVHKFSQTPYITAAFTEDNSWDFGDEDDNPLDSNE